MWRSEASATPATHAIGIAKLPEVTQPIDPAVTTPEISRMHGATIDAQRGLVYWQAACTNRFYTTDIRTGETKEFPLDFAALGITGADGGLCLNEWVFDERSGSAIALGGVPIATGHGRVQFAFAVKDDGRIAVLRDLRAALDAERFFNHPFQSIVSFDQARQEILTGGAMVIGEPDPENQQRLRLAPDSGRVEVSNGGSSVQAQFFDRALERHLFWNCRLPGVSDEASLSIEIGAEDLHENGLESTTDLCYQGFLGAVSDSDDQRVLVLARQGQITDPSRTLAIGVLDVEKRRWSHWMPTDASYDLFGVTPDSGFESGQIPGKTFFFSVALAP